MQSMDDILLVSIFFVKGKLISHVDFVQHKIEGSPLLDTGQ